MARKRYFDYKAPDATLSLNEHYRGILKSGVYFGFNVVPGSTGMLLSIQMDNDPDNVGKKLGSIITRDGVVIQEDSDLIDVALVPTANPTLTRIDYLVATYIYNASVPNNDVNYAVISGTPFNPLVQNPVPPVLNENQLLLAILTIPPTTTTITTSMISDADRMDLYGTGDQAKVTDILVPGVYTGAAVVALAPTQIRIYPGVAITLEKSLINIPQKDVVCPLAANAQNARRDLIIALHKYDSSENNEPEVIIVRGNESAETTTFPVARTPAEINTQVSAYNRKYNWADIANTPNPYVTILAEVFVKGTTVGGGVQTMEVAHTPRLLNNRALYVTSGKMSYVPGSTAFNPATLTPNSPMVQPWPFTGTDGIRSALSLLQDMVASAYAGTDNNFLGVGTLKLIIDGDFRLGGSSPLIVPSFVEIEGQGKTSLRVPNLSQLKANTILLGGLLLKDATYVVKRPADGVPQTNVPAGYERLEVVVPNSSNYPPGVTTVTLGVKGGPLAGDEVYLDASASGNQFLKGWYDSTTVTTTTNNGYSFCCIMPAGYSSASASSTVMVSIIKRKNAVRNLAIKYIDASPDFTSMCSLWAVGCDESVIDNVNITNLVWSSVNKNCKVGTVRIEGGGFQQSNGDSVSKSAIGGRNTYDSLYIRTDYESIYNCIGCSLNDDSTKSMERDCVVGLITARLSKILTSSPVPRFILGFKNSQIGIVNIPEGYSAGGPSVSIASCDCTIGSFKINGQPTGLAGTTTGDVTAVYLFGIRNQISQMFHENGAGTNANLNLNNTTVSDGKGPRNSFGRIQGFNLVYGTDDNRKGSYQVQDAIKNRDEDINLKMVSTALFSWNATTGILSWSDPIVIDLPYSVNPLTIAAGSATMVLDGDRLLCNLQRDPSSPTVVTAFVGNKSATPQLRNTEAMFIAQRFGTDMYLWDGTRIPTGLSLRLAQGTGELANNSVTRVKLAADAYAQLNATLEHFFAVNPNLPKDGGPVVEVPLFIGSDGGINNPPYFPIWNGVGTYDATTGNLTMSAGYATYDVSLVKAGDTVLDGNYRRHEVLGITLPNIINLRKGLTYSGTALSLPMVFRGNMCYASAYTGIPTVSEVSTDTTLTNINLYLNTFSAGMLRDGMYIVDSNGSKFRIFDVPVGPGDGSTNIKVYARTKPVFAANGILKAYFNNNPMGLSLMDCKPTLGVEVVPILDIARRQRRYQSEISDTYPQGPLWDILPKDPRVVLVGDAIPARYNNYVYGPVNSGASLGMFNSATSHNATIMVTGWFTELALQIAGSNATFLGSDVNIWIDGVLANRTYQLGNAIVDGLESSYNNALGTVEQPVWWSSSLLRNLTPGVHTVRIGFPSASNPVTVQAVAFINKPNDDGTYNEVGGRLYADGTSYDYTTTKVTVPTLSKRGGKVIRYVTKADPTVKAWAIQALAEAATTGDTSTVSPTITNIPIPSQFRVGDMVRIRYATGCERRLVTAVGTSSIDVSPNPSQSYTESALENCGRTYRSQIKGQWDDFNRSNESEVLLMPTTIFSYNNNTFKNNWLDGAQCYYPLTANITNVFRRPWTDVCVTSGKVRIGFIGTGLDLIMTSPTPGNAASPFPAVKIGVTLDDIVLGTADQVWGTQATTTNYQQWGEPTATAVAGNFTAQRAPINNNDFVRVPICQDLDYGYHVAIFDFSGNSASTAYLRGLSIFEPKHPTYEGYPIWESNFMAKLPVTLTGGTADDSNSSFGQSTSTHGVGTGMISYDLFGSIVNATASWTAGYSGDSGSSVGSTAFNPLTIEHGSSAAGTVINTHNGSRFYYYHWFYGDSVEIDATAPNGTTLNWRNGSILDNNGSFVDFSAYKGCTVTTITSNPTGVSGFLVIGYKFSKVGLYCMRFEATDTTNNGTAFGGSVTLNRIKSGGPFHLTQRRHNLNTYDMFAAKSGGRDRRSLVGERDFINPPISMDKFPRSINSETVQNVGQDRVQQLTVVSDGNWYDITLSGMAAGDTSYTTASNRPGLELNVETLSPPTPSGTVLYGYNARNVWLPTYTSGLTSLNNLHPYSLTMPVYLPPGIHVLSVNFMDFSVLTNQGKVANQHNGELVAAVRTSHGGRGGIRQEATLRWPTEITRAYN